jgi:TolB-like protein/Flp pilus assembly protein TadD
MTIAPYTMQLRGPFGMYRRDGRRIEVASRKGIALIALLAMSQRGERSRIWLQNMLWGSREPEQAQASLRRELANLRLVPDVRSLLQIDRVRVVLDIGQIDIDERVTDRSSDYTHGSRSASLDFLEGIDILGEEMFEDWLRGQRSLGPPSRIPGASGIASHGPRPGLAVSTFKWLGDDDTNGYLGAAFAEEIAVALGGYSGLSVVAAVEAQLDDRPAAVRDMAARLGVGYVLTGSLRSVGDGLRVNIRLLEGRSARQLWAGRFEGHRHDLLDLQVHVATSVAPQIDVTLETNERDAALRRPVETIDAHGLFWRANALFRQWQPAAMHEAIGLADRVLDLEPANAWASILGAFCHATVYAASWSDDRAAHLSAARDLYGRALQYGSDDAFVLGYAAGTLIAIGGDLELADRLIDRAIVLQPISAPTLFWGGWVDVAGGRFERAHRRFALALQYSPRSPGRPYMLAGIGVCLLATGQPADAISLLQEATSLAPHYQIGLAGLTVALVLCNRIAEATEVASALRRSGGIGSALAVLRDPAHRQLLEHGIAVAEAGARVAT